MTVVIASQSGRPPIAAVAPAVRIAPASPGDSESVMAMLGRCSRSSLFHRFHGPSDGVAYTSAQLRRAGDYVLLAWDGPRCVAMGVLALAASSGVGADLGVLVEDEYQRRGVGTAILDGVMAECARRRMPTVHADVMGEDAYLVRILRRLGPTCVSIHAGSYSVDIEIASSLSPDRRRRVGA